MNEFFFQICELSFLKNGPYSLIVDENELIGMTGPSGIGKTQMLRALVEAIAFSGSIFLEGVSSQNFAAPDWRKKISLVPAEPVWWRDTVGDHFTKLSDNSELHRLIHNLGFEEDVLSWTIRRLSTGERQRLALVRAIIQQPTILLLDEPCSALDANSVKRVEHLILDYNSLPKKAVIWVSHDLEQLKRIADICYTVEKTNLKRSWST